MTASPEATRRGPHTDDDLLRTAMIEAAEKLLARSEDQDIATRAVCEAVGVTQPRLYRLFGDKRGLLDAVADAGFERYARHKAQLEQTGDPVVDLHTGWDDHMDFAGANPALYQLMFAPRPHSHSQARRQILALLEASLLRCSAIGALRIDVNHAAQLILSSNVGVALSRIAEPDLFDEGLSHRARDAAFGAVLALPATSATEDPVSDAARQLHSQLTLTGSEALEPAEESLLERWLERIVERSGRARPENT
ncbi:TetR/AcrR family transcriptional regulator [Kineosporia sp. NBRC 101731]|uniref:TetR/AcrR family transcriptional regulator n=1 Tax=Kineosporia sp. NBRC 101731 TaxID=3032199 RepID=UPI0024A4AE49|nr:TetR/AcrR family transcriptional regulator [Kineosporia sp. NBRC 101731]GLY30679.1 TetR family transcriptional regulator [Kineosporia sp. NBRC 101731]